MMKKTLILILGIILGIFGTLCYVRVQEKIARQVKDQFVPVLDAQMVTYMFFAQTGTFPKDISELQTFAATANGTHFEPEKFSELRFEQTSPTSAKMIWRLAAPYDTSSGTGIVTCVSRKTE